MVSGFYNAGIAVYQGLLRLAAPFNQKAQQWVTGRRNWQSTLNSFLAGNAFPIVWFHAASLGEFEQGRPVMEAFREQYPNYKILLTFFSPSGYEVRKNYAGADYVLYLPADTPANAREFVRLVKPEMVFFIKYEFWYNYLHELRKRNIPIISFSTIFRPNQLFFRELGPISQFYKSLLGYFDHILVQNQESVDLLASIGMTNVTLAGDTRFDRVAHVASTKKDIPIAQAFKSETPLLVVGSAWQADMAILLPFINQFDKPLKVIIAPHEIHDDEIERWRSQLTKTSIRFSQTNVADAQTADVLFIDNIGMLSSLYQYGEFAHIGGAFGKGLHNILEAATFGMPLFFGPNYTKFQEAVDLIKEGAAFPVRDTSEFQTAFVKQYENPSEATLISRHYVLRNIGATEKVMDVVKKIMSERMKERKSE
ncbi:3-deoxy-D-manno-octulosonic acid transferase [Spirosoma sp. BT702]|uniref:3-deoxy-D-manno-octulosonic acid transferase n=1 Tax=Spirosoma profusum TaxID=2771354 RepID=A0A926Y2M5_9BACT|nr:glycosyltransferase N-terminal domain-containing protein [Spirosoma profusum]MBD2702648.1 3-deoxy-D-manno-octulosonic acid transferase [Spirosoma profusum]